MSCEHNRKSRGKHDCWLEKEKHHHESKLVSRVGGRLNKRV